MPDAASLPRKPNVTAWLYQSPWSGGRSAEAPETVGGVSSYLNTAGGPAAVRPAPLVQLPPTAAAALSGPAYAALVQLEIPDPGSSPVNAIVKAWLNQPLWSGARLAAPATASGGPASKLNVG